MLVDAWEQRSVAIGERVVGGFYPSALASQELHDATQTVARRQPDAPRRPWCARSPRTATRIARALRAQARDAQG